jgi:ABC-type antimicrobial peptide transport system permease subunit
MRVIDTLITATQNLGRRKVRTVLTSVGVFVGILTIVTMVSLGVGIQTQITDTIRAFGLENVLVEPDIPSQPRGAFNPNARLRPDIPLNDAAIAQLRAMPGVESIAVGLGLPADPEMTLTLNERTFEVAMRDRAPEERIFAARLTPIAGQELAQTPDERGVALAPRLLRGAGFRTEDFASLIGKPATINLTAPRGDTYTLETTLVGIVEIPGRQGMDVGNADKADIKRWWYNDPQIMETEGYDWAILRTASTNDAVRISQEVERQGFSGATLQVLLDQVNRIFAILQVMLSSVGLLALAVASIGIVNTMIMAIYERTREIGVLKALGASNGDVLRMFMVEAGMIGLLGGVVGVLGGWLLGLAGNAYILDLLKREQVPITDPFFLVTPELVAGSLVFATLVGIVAGLYPAFRAARLDPLAALRHE